MIVSHKGPTKSKPLQSDPQYPAYLKNVVDSGEPPRGNNVAQDDREKKRDEALGFAVAHMAMVADAFLLTQEIQTFVGRNLAAVLDYIEQAVKA